MTKIGKLKSLREDNKNGNGYTDIINKINEIIDHINQLSDNSVQLDVFTPFCNNCAKFHKKSEKCEFIDITPTQSTLDEVVEKIKPYLRDDSMRDAFGKVSDGYVIEDVRDILSPYIQDKQEQLIPLDVEKVVDLFVGSFARRYEIINDNMYICYRALDEGVIKDRLKAILSKYGVPKQEKIQGKSVDIVFMDEGMYADGVRVKDYTKKYIPVQPLENIEPSKGDWIDKVAEEIIPKFEGYLNYQDYVDAEGYGGGEYQKKYISEAIKKFMPSKGESTVENIEYGHAVAPDGKGGFITPNCIIPTPKSQDSSIVDVDTLLNTLKTPYENLFYALENPGFGVVEKAENIIKSILSSLPIQKKFTEEEVESYWNLDSTEDEVIHTISFLKRHHLMAE